MLQTNYNLPIDLEIVCENETLKKIVGTAGVESARRTHEQWNYMPVLCYMRFSPYKMCVTLNRFADPNKKYSCKVYIDGKRVLSTIPLKNNKPFYSKGTRNGGGNKRYPYEFDLAMMDPGAEKPGSSTLSDAGAERLIRKMSTFTLEVFENSTKMTTKTRRDRATNVPERTKVPMDDKLNGVNKVSTRFGVSVVFIYIYIYRHRYH